MRFAKSSDSGSRPRATEISLRSVRIFRLGDFRSASGTWLKFTFRILPLITRRDYFRRVKKRMRDCRAHQIFQLFGSFCLSFSTGSKRSPSFFTRATALSHRNLSSSGFFFFRQVLDFLPCHRRRNGGLVFRAQRINTDRCLVLDHSGSNRRKPSPFAMPSTSLKSPAPDVRARGVAPNDGRHLLFGRMSLAC